MEQLVAPASFVLTLFIFSYLLGDNFLYRLAVYVFVGLAAAYTTIVTFESVILPQLNERGSIILTGIALVLALLLIAKPLIRLAPITSLAVAFLVAVGAALAVVGAISGTLIPLTASTSTAVETNVLDGVILVIGTITSLIYFQYYARPREDNSPIRGRLSGVLANIGQGFIMVTLGTLYGAAIITSLTILTERINFLVGG